MLAQRVGIREVKARLSHYVRSVRPGQEIIITDRGRPVGKIVAVEESEYGFHERLCRLEESGLIEAARPGAGCTVPCPIPLPDGMAQGMLNEDRGYE